LIYIYIYIYIYICREREREREIGFGRRTNWHDSLMVYWDEGIEARERNFAKNLIPLCLDI
jgi:hypothetical protein